MMVISIIILSIAVILMFIALAFCVMAIIDSNATVNCLNDHLRRIEEKQARGAELVYQKFGYRIPFSESYLRLEELKLEHAKKQEGE